MRIMSTCYVHVKMKNPQAGKRKRKRKQSAGSGASALVGGIATLQSIANAISETFIMEKWFDISMCGFLSHAANYLRFCT